MSYTEYTKLNKYEEYDRGAAEELAAALNERAELQRRVEELDELARENQQLKPFLWQTAEGKVMALHTIEDDHLKNILTHLARNGRPINKALKAEARRRGLALPSERKVLLPAPPQDLEEWWEDELDHGA